MVHKISRVLRVNIKEILAPNGMEGRKSPYIWLDHEQALIIKSISGIIFLSFFLVPFFFFFFVPESPKYGENIASLSQ